MVLPTPMKEPMIERSLYVTRNQCGYQRGKMEEPCPRYTPSGKANIICEAQNTSVAFEHIRCCRASRLPMDSTGPITKDRSVHRFLLQQPGDRVSAHITSLGDKYC